MTIYITGSISGSQLSYNTGDATSVKNDLGISLLDISGLNNAVFTTGNQIISGVKTFVDDTIFGTGDLALLVDDTSVYINNLTASGNSNFVNRPLVSSIPVLLSGDINLAGYITTGQTGAFYPASNPSGFISGVSQFSYLSGDLTGSLLSPTLSYIQGNPINATSPSAGQTLQWNGSAWTPGSIPNGGNGGGGIVYYLNFANTSGVAPATGLPTSPVGPSQLGKNYSVGSGSITSANLTQGSYSLVCGFVSISGEPGVTNIPAGLWDFNIWADILGGAGNANQTQFQVRIYKYNPIAETYTSIANSDDVFVYDPVSIAQYIANVTIPQTTILATDRIYVELWAQKNVHQSRQIRFYFDSLHPSHIHTTLPSVAGNGVVKVVNGVFQSPASLITDIDVSTTANIQQSKIENLSTDLASFYPRSNPSGYITTSQTGAFYPASNPSGFVTTATITGEYVGNITNNISGATKINNMMQITLSGYNALGVNVSPDTLYIIVG